MREKLEKLLNNSYAKYSNYRVSAICVMKDGKEIPGVNVENASFGATVCAERVAITSAIAMGYKKGDFCELHVMVNSDKIGMPCFICRQVISEFFDKETKVFVYSKSDRKEFTVDEICPYPFNEEKFMKSGMVSIVGRPNVGKSTLLNEIMQKKVAITSDKMGTTRNIILGVYNDNDSQIVFVDTPGIHKPQNKLGKVLNDKAYLMTNDIDVILFMVDISRGFGKGDKFVLERIKECNSKVILLLNKIDNISKDELIKRIDEIKDIYDFNEIIPLSAIKNINVNELIKTIKKYLPNEGKYYDDDYITNQPMSLIITERVREKVLRLTHDEIPHTVTCILDTLEDKKNILKAGVTIIVDRENLKKILIGKNGKMLKEIGTKARLDLEEYFNKKVFLELYVKVIKNWRDKDNLISELGLKDDLGE